jgi:hypothetical protein
MKKTQFTENQIVSTFKKQEAGVPRLRTYAKPKEQLRFHLNFHFATDGVPNLPSRQLLNS